VRYPLVLFLVLGSAGGLTTFLLGIGDETRWGLGCSLAYVVVVFVVGVGGDGHAVYRPRTVYTFSISILPNGS
jgi:hypothetical protein